MPDLRGEARTDLAAAGGSHLFEPAKVLLLQATGGRADDATAALARFADGPLDGATTTTKPLTRGRNPAALTIRETRGPHARTTCYHPGSAGLLPLGTEAEAKRLTVVAPEGVERP